jgi:hypothetical protein
MKEEFKTLKKVENSSFLFLFKKKEEINMHTNKIEKMWGNVITSTTIDSGIEYYKCQHGEGYVVDINKLPEGKGKFITSDGQYIIHNSDWKELIKIKPTFAPIIYQTQDNLRKIYKNFNEFIKKIIGMCKIN